MLDLKDVNVYYGAVHALKGLSLNVEEGEIVTLIGSNGAGKSTTIKAISGIVAVESGTIEFEGEPIAGMPPHKVVGCGIVQIPEGRRVFPEMSVRENLEMGAYSRKDRAQIGEDLGRIFDRFPRLKERETQLAATLSGGEQQMLAIGRALIGKPELLLLDEPSMGLAPLGVERIFEALAKPHGEGLTMLMVEQSAEMALSLAHRGIILQNGSVAVSGLAEALRSDERVHASYLGSSRS